MNIVFSYDQNHFVPKHKKNYLENKTNDVQVIFKGWTLCFNKNKQTKKTIQPTLLQFLQLNWKQQKC